MIDRDDPEWADVFIRRDAEPLATPSISEIEVFFQTGVQCWVCGHWSGPDGKHKPHCPRDT